MERGLILKNIIVEMYSNGYDNILRLVFVCICKLLVCRLVKLFAFHL